MTAGILLGTYGAASGLLGAAALGRPWAWASRAPRLAISLWLALLLSWLLSVILAALTLTVPLSLSWPGSGPGSGGPMPGGRMAPGATAGLLLAAAVSLRACGCLASSLRRARRERREHARFLAAMGRPDPGLGAAIIDAGVPLAYCLPYGGQRVVVSTRALDVLSPGQLQAVLAHERAHLRGRHHLMLTAVSALTRAFPGVPLLAQAGPQLAVLAEMAADDAAARSHDPASLAAALVILARAPGQAAALTAGGVAAAARVERMLAPPARPGWLAGQKRQARWRDRGARPAGRPRLPAAADRRLRRRQPALARAYGRAGHRRQVRSQRRTGGKPRMILAAAHDSFLHPDGHLGVRRDTTARCQCRSSRSTETEAYFW